MTIVDVLKCTFTLRLISSGERERKEEEEEKGRFQLCYLNGAPLFISSPINKRPCHLILLHRHAITITLHFKVRCTQGRITNRSRREVTAESLNFICRNNYTHQHNDIKQIKVISEDFYNIQ